VKMRASSTRVQYMILIVYKGLEAFRYFSNTDLTEFGEGGMALMKCAIRLS